MGSHQPVQALVGRSMRSCTEPNERMGFVQAGGVERVPGWQGQTICAAMRWRDTAHDNARVEGTPCPPGRQLRVGVPRNFSPVFL